MRKRFVRRCCLLYATTKKYPHPQKRKRPFPHLVYYGHVPTIDNYPFSSVYLVAREKKQPGLSSYQAIIVIMTCVLTRRSITRKKSEQTSDFLFGHKRTNTRHVILSLSFWSSHKKNIKPFTCIINATHLVLLHAPENHQLKRINCWPNDALLL